MFDYFKARWYNYSGRNFGQPKKQGWAAAVHSEVLPSLYKQWYRSLQTSEPFQVEVRVPGRDLPVVSDSGGRGERHKRENFAVGRYLHRYGRTAARYARQLLEREAYFRQMGAVTRISFGYGLAVSYAPGRQRTRTSDFYFCQRAAGTLFPDSFGWLTDKQPF
jgi:hypothetical protein